ncbi:hypothetical protein SLE2022_092830 [Rubroshorea leprosula]
MGGSGYTRQRKSSSSFSILNIFKCCCSQGRDDISEEGMYVRAKAKDDDGIPCTADPGIDRRASAFIDRFKRSVTESERQILAA